MPSSASNKPVNPINEEETTATANKPQANKPNRLGYLNSQLNMKRSPSIRTQLTNDLIEQNRNLKRLKEEQNLKNSIKKSKFHWLGRQIKTRLKFTN